MAEAPVIFTCTFYTSEADVRLACCLKFLGQCRAHGPDGRAIEAGGLRSGGPAREGRAWGRVKSCG